MKTQSIICPLCGTSYDSSSRVACSSCPIGQDCTMVCCPTCGHTTIDESQSKLANWVGSILGTPAERQARQRLQLEIVEAATLAEADVGSTAIVLDFKALPDSRKRHLNAYGLSPGAEVIIRQQSPVTIFEIDQTEIALERQLAAKIRVQPADSSQSQP